ncbi:MAG: hypothetical protein U0744_13305 [Gemmataceae bacterium]
MTPDFSTSFDAIRASVKETLAKIPPPDGVVYACGFWLFYADYTVLGTPCFAYNFVGQEKDAKWSPPEWVVDVDDRMVDALKPHYERLSESMKGQSDEAWDSLIEFQLNYYSRLCIEITRDASLLLRDWRITDDFVCGIFEEREDEETFLRLLHASMGEEVVERLGILQDG